MKGDWADDAVCAQTDPEAFFAPFEGRGGSRHSKDVRQAVALCHECPVRKECLREAMAEESVDYLRFGIRGGLTPTERAELAQARRKRAA